MNCVRLVSLIVLILSPTLYAQLAGYETYFHENEKQRIAEKKRRAALTPEQRAFEDYKKKQQYIAKNCKDIKGRVLLSVSQIKQKINTTDQSNYDNAIFAIEDLQKITQSCDFKMNEIGLSESIFRTWKDQVYEIALNHYQSQISLALRFNKRIPEGYIAKSKILMGMLGKTEEEIKKETKTWEYNVRLTEYEDYQNNFEYKSQFLDISNDYDLKKYRDVALLLGKSESEIDKKIEKWKMKGKESLEREKKMCTPKIDNRKPILGKPRSQEDLLWCAHFALADMLTHKLDQKISAADVAINFYDIPVLQATKELMGWGDYEMAAGFEKLAFNRLKSAGGACLESRFKSENISYSSLKNTLQDIHTIKTNNLMDDDPACKKKYAPPIQALFPELKDPYGILKSSSNVRVIKNLADKACGKRIDLSHLEANYESALTSAGQKAVFKIIDEQLTKKNVLTIEFNSSAIKKSNPAAHVNTVVGRRFNASKNQCEYLIRGTWGADGRSSDGDLDEETGNYWVPKWDLIQKTIGITYLE